MKSSSDLLHIVRNPVVYDSRVLKETYTLKESGLFNSLEIAGFMEPGHAPYETFDDGRNIWRADLTTRPLPKDLVSQSIKYVEWYGRLVQRYRQAPLKIIHCHDLGPLPIAVRLKRLTGAKLIYDAHELETESVNSRGVRQLIASRFEHLLITSVDAMITVSPSIKEWYAARYPNIPISLVRNVPEKPSHTYHSQPLRQWFQVPDDSLLFIYLGGLSKGRGIERVLQAFKDERVPHHVVFMGNGALKSMVEETNRACPRIHYLPPVLPKDVLRHTAGADVGLSFIDDACLSYRYSLPNKLFEPLLAGLPVLASDLPDQADIVNRYKAGWVVSNSTEELADFLAHLDADDARELRKNLPNRVSDLSWVQEREELLMLYRKLLNMYGL